MKRYNKLSAYTIANNCTDLADVIYGINEINQKINQLQKCGKPIPPTFYTRLFKLGNLKIKYEDFFNPNYEG